MARAATQAAVTAQPILLTLGFPDPTTLHTSQFQEAVGRVMQSPQAYRALEYGDEQGNAALIEYLARRISHEQGINADVENVMIVAGSTHAVDMIARLYTNPGGAVLVEAPTYADALHIFRDHGVDLHTVPVDHEGVIVDAFEATLKRLAAESNTPALFYTIPNFHNPTGLVTSEERRLRILQLAHQYGVTILEDDVYRELAFDTVLPPTYYALAKGVNVIQVGSFSKTLAPGLRLGWMVAPADVVHRCSFCGTTQMGGGANPLSAQIVAEFCQQGHLDTQLEHLRGLYKTRRDTMLAAFERSMLPTVKWTRPNGGFFVWVTLPDTVHSAAVREAALKRGVLVAAGGGYFVNPDDGKHNLRLTYSYASLGDIDKAIQILAEVIADLGGG